MEYSNKQPYFPQYPTAVSPAAVENPMMYENLPFVSPANVGPSYVSPANVGPSYVSPANVYPHYHVKPAAVYKAPCTSAGEILVLFILLVIISRAFRRI